MDRAHVAGISFKPSHTLLCGALLALLLLAVQAPLAIAQDRGTAALPAPAEPGWLGIQSQALGMASIKALGVDQAYAKLVIMPAPNGPADKAGLKTGDVILALNGQPITSGEDFTQQIKQAGKLSLVEVQIWRHGERVTLPVTLGDAKDAGAPVDIEQRIVALGAIIEAFPKSAFPSLWAWTQNNLGNDYLDRVRGNRAENIEAAIKAYEAALTVYTREAFPQVWAMIQDNLGHAYRDRIQGSRAENLEAAIKALEAVLTVFTREAFPQDWAMTQNNLGIAYEDRIQGSRAENIEVAIKALEAALTVRAREAIPQDWAVTQNNLGIAYQDRIQGSRAENLEAAINAYEAALTVHTSEAFPQEWASAQNNLGIAYHDRVQGSRAENLEAAIKAYEAALTVRTREVLPARLGHDPEQSGLRLSGPHPGQPGGEHRSRHQGL